MGNEGVWGCCMHKPSRTGAVRDLVGPPDGVGIFADLLTSLYGTPYRGPPCYFYFVACHMFAIRGSLF